MTDKELILNFIGQYDRPFNAELTAQMTSISIDVVERSLPELLQSQAIKQRPLNNTPAEPVRVNPCQFYAIFSRNLSFLPKFAIYSPQNASNLFIFSGNPEIWIDLSYLTIAK